MTKNTEQKLKQNQHPNNTKTTRKTTVDNRKLRPLTVAHTKWIEEYAKSGSVEAASRATGIATATGYRLRQRSDVQAQLRQIVENASQRASVSKADVIARAAELLDIALCRRAWKRDDDGTEHFLKAPNLAIAERLIGRLGDATGTWAKAEEGRPAPGGVNNWILGGNLADVLIARILPPPTLEHTPDVDSNGSK